MRAEVTFKTTVKESGLVIKALQTQLGISRFFASAVNATASERKAGEEEARLITKLLGDLGAHVPTGRLIDRDGRLTSVVELPGIRGVVGEQEKV